MRKGAKDLSETLKNLPEEPGVYLYFSAENQVIYVGKSTNLKKRVRSYFDRRSPDMKTNALVEKIWRIEFVVCQNEVEALLLECNLIKEYSPRYNILFKDGKSYPYIKIHCQLPYPYLEKVREVKKDGATYYGPYAEEWKVNQVMKYFDRHYNLIKCKEAILDQSGKACLDYQIGRCDGPCFQSIDDSFYQKEVEEILSILDGRVSQVQKRLIAQMRNLSDRLEYERAAAIRDQLQSLNTLSEKQDAHKARESDFDVISGALIGERGLVQHLKLRQGKIVDQVKTRTDHAKSLSELLFNYLKQFCFGIQDPPREICVTSEILEHEDFPMFMGAFQERFFRILQINEPQKGRKKRLLDMASKNAYEGLKVELQKEERSGSLLLNARKELGLRNVPYRVECFDISNIQGTDPVASMVVAIHGKMERSEYRKFKIRCKDTPDDFSMMREALTRRYSRLIREEKPMPDLIMVDGGLGQLGVAKEVLEALEIEVDLCSLAKREELVFTPEHKAGIQLGEFHAVRLFLQTIRDESHRFAVSYHRTLRKKRTLQSILEEVNGIGPARRAKILKAFPDLKKYKELSVADLRSLGIPEKPAAEVLQVVREAVLIGKIT